MPHQKTFAAADQQHAAVVTLDRRACRLDALDRERPLVKRPCGVSRGILDRQSGDAGLGCARYVGSDFVRLMGEAALEIGVDGQIDRAAQHGEMLQHLLERDAVVGLSDRPRKTGAGRGDRLEAEMLQRPGTADIPRVRQHEAAGLVHLAEDSALVRCGHRHDSFPRS